MKQPSGAMHTAEAISLMTQGLAPTHLNNGQLAARGIAAGLQGALVQDAIV